MPLITGTNAIYLGKRSAQEVTHKWCCYVRSPKPMHYIASVEFHLDEKTFDPSVIVLTKPPFQIQNQGWGEFYINVKINFHEPEKNKPVHLHPFLQLYEEGLPPKT